MLNHPCTSGQIPLGLGVVESFKYADEFHLLVTLILLLLFLFFASFCVIWTLLIVPL